MRVPFTVLRCSSESHKLPAANLETGDKFRPWCTDGEQTTATLELGLTRDASIGSIEVGNYGAAFIQVFASMEGFGESQMLVLLPTTTLMSMSEVKAATNRGRSKLFSHQLSRYKDHQKWKYVKVEVSQPFQPKGPIGLAYFILHDAAAEPQGQGPASRSTLQPPSSLLTVPTMPLTVPVLPGDEEEDEVPLGRMATGRNIKALQQQAHHQQQKKATEALAPPPPRPLPPSPAPPAAAPRTLPGSLQGPGGGGGAPSAWKAKLTAKPSDAKPTPKPKPTPAPSPTASPLRPTAKPTDRREPSFTAGKGLKGRAASEVHASDGKAPLKGCAVVLSGFTHPLRGELQRKAAALGAAYQGDWEDGASTHLVAAYASTPKTKLVRTGWIVKKEWLEDCYAHKKRQPEHGYGFGGGGGGGGGDSESSADTASTEASGLDDDDEFDGAAKGKKATVKAKTVLKRAGTKRDGGAAPPKPGHAPTAKKPKPDPASPAKAALTFSAKAPKADDAIFRSPTTLLSSTGGSAPIVTTTGGYDEWVRKDVSRLSDFARKRAAKDAFTFIKEIFKKCETYLVQYDDMFDVQRALWETWEYQHELALPMAVRMLCKLDTHGLSDADGRRLVADTLKSYKQQYLNALLDLLEEMKPAPKPKPPTAKTAAAAPPAASIPATLLVDADEDVPLPSPAAPPTTALPREDLSALSDTDSEATQPMSKEEQAEGLRALQCATAKPAVLLLDFLKPVTAYIHPPEETPTRRRLVRQLVAYGADVAATADQPATHVIVCGVDHSGVKRRRGVKYVRPEWLEECHKSQARVAEDDFLVNFRR